MQRSSCINCNASILVATSKQCAGVCMGCFMKANNGHRPSELQSLQRRGLVQFFAKWETFYKKGFSTPVYRISNTQHNILLSYATLIVSEVNSFLKRGEDKFKTSSGTEKILTELEFIESDQIKKYIQQVRSFHKKLREKT